SQPPATTIDGIIAGKKITGTSTELTHIELDRRALTDPLFDLQLTTLPTGNNNTITVRLSMTARKAVNTPLIAQVALVENQTGTFKNVLRKQLFGADGETITLPFNVNDNVSRQKDNIEINVPITNPSQLTLIGYVQDKNTKEIYQSIVVPAPTLQGAVVVGVEPDPLKSTTLNGIAIYPNPANGSFNFGLPDNTTSEGFTWKLLDQRGITVESGDFSNLINNTKSVNVSGLANGIYFITLSGPGGSVVHRKLVVMNRN
ncbi:MAG: T9SS type A sorting domain-containing protein, partial [Cyclobacteriaceae bacterium]|nr:T9SS type A sorting domain-containing protein [Cyclobacteriaceae bacterium]